MQSEVYEIAGIKFSLTEREGKEFSTIISQMSDMPDLKSMIETDENGMITYFSPNRVSWSLIFFVQNLMIMQRLRLIDEFAKEKGVLND